jgi:hypothetical protein
MEIKRKFEMSVATNRRYIIRQSKQVGQIACAECGEPMLTTEQATGLFDIKQRRIFQIIENEAAHFTENATGVVMICMTSLAEVLDGGQTRTPEKVAGGKRRSDGISIAPLLEINK